MSPEIVEHSFALMERLLAAIVLAACAWPIVRPCTSAAFRTAFPLFFAALLALLAAYAMGLVVVVVHAPLWALDLAVAVVGVLVAALHRHAAVTRGAARGWPPGSLRPLALGPWFDRGFFLDEHRRLGSPFKTVQFVRPMACVVGLADGLDFLKANEAALGSPAMHFGRFIPGGFLRHMPLERHAATKSLFGAAFAREVYAPLAPFVRATFRAELARMARESGGAGVAPRRHVQRAVFTIWMRLFYDIEPDTPARARLQTLYRTLDIRNPTYASDPAVRAARDEIVAIVRARHVPGAGSVLAALARAQAGALDDPALVGNLVYLAHTSWADVSGLLVWVFRMLTEHAEWAERLRNAPDAELAARIVMETLRLEQSEHVYRVAERDLAWGDMVIPRGWLVRLCVRESHQDPRVFAKPWRFDPDRFRDRRYTLREYSPFGGGLRHACLGEGLTLFMGALFAEELATGFRWRTVADGPPEYSAWRHWRPSSAWRVAVTAPPEAGGGEHSSGRGAG